MRWTQILVLAAAFVGGTFVGEVMVSSSKLTAQTRPQVPLSGPAGQRIGGGLTVGEIVANHRTPATTGVDTLVGGFWGRTIPLGPVAANESIKLSFSTFDPITGSFTDCEIVVWIAIKAANNSNGLQQSTFRFTGSGMKTINVARNGEAFMVIQTQKATEGCAVATSASVIEDS